MFRTDVEVTAAIEAEEHWIADRTGGRASGKQNIQGRESQANPCKITKVKRSRCAANFIRTLGKFISPFILRPCRWMPRRVLRRDA
jgi:hypothetical protein